MVLRVEAETRGAVIDAVGLQASFVAVAPNGEIVGHIGVVRQHPDDRVAEIGQAIVVPELRNRHLFKQLKQMAIDHCRENDIDGMYSEVVTVHTHSQEGNLSLGARETGILLAYSPVCQFRGIDQARQSREALVLFYTRVNQEPPQTVHVPDAHRDIIAAIYERGGFQRELLTPVNADVPPNARLDITVVPEIGMASITVQRYGADLADTVRGHTRALCEQDVKVIYLDLPMDHPAAATTVPALEQIGYSFAGLIPELHGADVLRLQLLNNTPVEPAEIQLASDFGKRLLDYVLAHLKALV